MVNTVMNTSRYRLGIPGTEGHQIYTRVDALGLDVRNASEGNDPFSILDYDPIKMWSDLSKIRKESGDPAVIPVVFRIGNQRVSGMLDIETYELLAQDADYLNRLRGSYRRVELEKLFNDDSILLSDGNYGTIWDEKDPKVRAEMVKYTTQKADKMFDPEFKKYLVSLSEKAGYPKLEELKEMFVDDDPNM